MRRVFRSNSLVQMFQIDASRVLTALVVLRSLALVVTLKKIRFYLNYFSNDTQVTRIENYTILLYLKVVETYLDNTLFF